MLSAARLFALVTIALSVAGCGPTYETECEAECTAANDTDGSCTQEDVDECLSYCAQLTSGRNADCAACLFEFSGDMAVNPESGRCLQPAWEDPADTLCDDECGG